MNKFSANDMRKSLSNTIATMPDDDIFKLLNGLKTIFGKATEDVEIESKDSLRIDDNSYFILRYEITAPLVISAVKSFCVRNGESEYSVKILRGDGPSSAAQIFLGKTVVLTESFDVGDEVVILGYANSDSLIAKAILSAKQYEMFNGFSTLEEKAVAIKQFAVTPEKIRENIVRQAFGKRCDEDDYNDPMRLVSKEMLEFKFRMCKRSYSPQQRADIRALFDELDSRDIRSIDKTHAKKKLNYILNIEHSVAPEINMTKEQIIAGLDKCLYGQKALKERIAEAIIASKYSGVAGFAILLVGSPGLGKTAIAQAVAKVLSRPFFKFSLGSVTSLLELVGDSSQYEASDIGDFVKAYYKAGTTSVVALLDEIGSAGNFPKEGGRVTKAFNDAISDEHRFNDSYLGTYINTENTIFIATANSTDGIPENLINRFVVINVDDYTDEEKTVIARDYLLPKLLNKFDARSDEIIISDEDIVYIANDFCQDEGVRDLSKQLENLVNKIITLWDSQGKRVPFVIDRAFIDDNLSALIAKNSPVITYRRNRELYSPEVSAEIKRLIAYLNNDRLDNVEEREKSKRKLEYLTKLIPVGDAFTSFDCEAFYEAVDKTHKGCDEAKDAIAQILYNKSVCGKPLTSTRLLFVGPAGTGKTSFAKGIAKACNAEYCRVSLNGVADPTIIKGHTFTYLGANAGEIVKGLYSVGTKKAVVHLDEIDKMLSHGSVSASSALLDLLDDSAEFTDNFLGVIEDLSDVMFIATANDLSMIDPILLDRFTIIRFDGYDQYEKKELISDHLIPKVIAELCPKTVKMTFSDEARQLLIEKYCRSFGVRDADKVVRKLVLDKVFSLRNKKVSKAVIGVKDIEKCLGKPKRERGNFPDVKYPGLSRALAVTSDSCGMSFAVETKLIPDEDSITITGLPRESTLDSVKLATSYIKCAYPGKLTSKGIHVHFGEGAIVKDGPSAGVAILMSMLSATLNQTITEDVAYTGEINVNGYVFNIGGTVNKIQAAQQAGCSKVYIPYGNYEELDKDVIKRFDIEIVPIKHVSEVIKDIFPDAAITAA